MMMLSNLREVSNDIISSIAGSAACVYTGQPFDTLKVRMQVNPGEFTNGPLQCFKNTVSKEAVSSLWKGSVPAFLGALAENAVAFGINGCLNRIMNPTEHSSLSSENIDWKQPVVIGGITGVFTAFVLCPSDVIKCRAQMMVTGPTRATTRSITADFIAKRGYSGLFTGINAQLLRDIPFGAVFFGSYEIMCQLFRRHTGLQDSTIFFVSGGFAGQLAWLATIGIDSVKSAIQTSESPQSVARTAKDIYATRGLRGFFVGTGMTVLRAFPSNAALFLAYEQTKKLLG